MPNISKNKVITNSIKQVSNNIVPYKKNNQSMTFSLISNRKLSSIQLKVTGNKHCKSCSGK